MVVWDEVGDGRNLGDIWRKRDVYICHYLTTSLLQTSRLRIPTNLSVQYLLSEVCRSMDGHIS